MTTLELYKRTAVIRNEILAISHDLREKLIEEGVSWKEVATFDRIGAIMLCRSQENANNIAEAKDMVNDFLKQELQEAHGSP